MGELRTKNSWYPWFASTRSPLPATLSKWSSRCPKSKRERSNSAAVSNCNRLHAAGPLGRLSARSCRRVGPQSGTRAELEHSLRSVWVIPGDGWICLSLATSSDLSWLDSRGLTCNTVENAVSGRVVKWTASPTRGRAGQAVQGLVPDAVAEVSALVRRDRHVQRRERSLLLCRRRAQGLDHLGDRTRVSPPTRGAVSVNESVVPRERMHQSRRLIELRVGVPVDHYSGDLEQILRAR
jgi:hypothetical protein